MLEQLLFTWLPDGPNGPGFQVAGASDGLADPTSEQTEIAVGLCKYVRPTTPTTDRPAPVSFGWVDVGSRRYVFRRGYLGREASGRPGNFYAHVLAGPRECAPALEMIERYDSKLWWRGEPLSSERGLPWRNLRAISLASFPGTAVTNQVRRSETGQLVECLLDPTRSGPVVLPADPVSFLSLVAALDERLPGIVDDLSVSTYEVDLHQTEFDVVGMPIVPTPDVLPADVQRTSQLVMSDAPSDRDVVRMALVSTNGGGAKRSRALFQCIRLFAEFDDGGHIDDATLHMVLSHTGAATALLSRPHGRRAVIRAVLNGNSSISRRLAETSRLVDPSLLAPMADDGAHLAARSENLDVAALVTHLDAMPKAYAKAVRSRLAGISSAGFPAWFRSLSETAASDILMDASTTSDRLRFFEHYASSVTPARRIPLLRHAIDWEDNPEIWDSTVADTISCHVLTSGIDHVVRGAAALVERVPGPKSQSWVAILSPHASPRATIEAVCAIEDDVAARHAAQHVLTAFGRTERARPDLPELLQPLISERFRADDVAIWLLEAAFDNSARTSAFAHVLFILRWIETGDLRTVRIGLHRRCLRPLKLDELAVNLVSALTTTDWNRARSLLNDMDRARRWWSGLPGHRERR